MKRIKEKFAELKLQKKSALITYICAGDPNYETSLNTFKALPGAGADIIELGVPFLDPSGDGPIIEEAGKRAVLGGMSLAKIFKMVVEFRKHDEKTPIILMTYYNPLLKFGINKIFAEAEKSGVDGMLIVDLPPEEESEILEEIGKTKLDLIRLIAPTTDIERAKKITKNAGGFLYLISMMGITGTKSAELEENKKNLEKLRQVSDLPVAIGFGINNPTQAQEFAKLGFDGVVVGSAIVKEIGNAVEIVKEFAHLLKSC